MIKKLLMLAGPLALSLSLSGAAVADDAANDLQKKHTQRKHIDGTKDADHDGDHDGRAVKAGQTHTLPAQASAKAKAFGQQGRRERALHAAQDVIKDESERAARGGDAHPAGKGQGDRDGHGAAAAAHDGGRTPSTGTHTDNGLGNGGSDPGKGMGDPGGTNPGKGHAR